MEPRFLRSAGPHAGFASVGLYHPFASAGAYLPFASGYVTLWIVEKVPRHWPCQLLEEEPAESVWQVRICWQAQTGPQGPAGQGGPLGPRGDEPSPTDAKEGYCPQRHKPHICPPNPWNYAQNEQIGSIPSRSTPPTRTIGVYSQIRRHGGRQTI